MPFTIPPDTRAVGTPDPPGDMNKTADTLTALAAFNVQNAAYAGGAAGDGTTDDTAAINAAISAAGGAGGGVVILPPGTYKTTGTVSIAADNVTLRGHGWHSVIQPAAGSNFDAISTPLPPAAGTSGYIRNYIGVENLMVDQSNMN